MNGPLLALFPRSWRDRYGEEVTELLANSTRPVRDRLDLVRTAAGIHRDRLRTKAPMRRTILLSSLLLIALGLVTATMATSQMRDGVMELPTHWWGGLALLSLLVGAVGVSVTAATGRHHGPT